MKVMIPKEITENEKRIAIVPEIIQKLIKKGMTVGVETGAGEGANIPDDWFAQAGAEIIGTHKKIFEDADTVLKVQRPTSEEFGWMKPDSLSISFFYPLTNYDSAKTAADKKVNVISVDSIPRITKAQRMDVLSSQTNIAGYKAVLIVANELGKAIPMMMTAAGTIKPSKFVIMGAGVAGLQAIATARRLGAIVEVSDIRKAAKEEVESLGARFIDLGNQEDFATKDGYAKEASEDFIRNQQSILKKHIADADGVITTALIPGKKAPVLITADMVAAMKPGSVILDMAIEFGGNVVGSKTGKTVTSNGVIILGEPNLPSRLAYQSSELYSRNLSNLIDYLFKNGTIELNPEDDILKGCLITHQGKIIHAATLETVK